MQVGDSVVGPSYRLGPRVPLQDRNILYEPTQVVGIGSPSRVIARSSATTTNCLVDGGDKCEKPAASIPLTLPITLGIVIPLVAIACVLVYLHRRGVNKVKREDMLDPHKSLDFGLAMDPTRRKAVPKRTSFFSGEKDLSANKHRQLSMDMNLSSPYLLPPELHNSRESLHSLARSLHQNEDPYRPVAHYASSDVASMRSFQKDAGDMSSVYASSSNSGSHDNRGPVSHQDSLSIPPRTPRARSPLPPPYPENTANAKTNNIDAKLPLSMPSPPRPVMNASGAEKSVSNLDTVPEAAHTTGPPTGNRVSGNEALDPAQDLKMPAPVTSSVSRKGLPVSPRPAANGLPPSISHRSVSEAGTVEEPFIYDSPSTALGKTSPSMDLPTLNIDTSLDFSSSGPAFSPPPRGDSRKDSFPARQSSYSNGDAVPLPLAPTLPIVEEPQEYYEDVEYSEDPQNHNQPMNHQQPAGYSQNDTHNGFGGSQQNGLSAPQVDSRRLSVGFRPLPPNELMETEDPETRANRIRSFYKEYFDDSRPNPAEYNQHYPPAGMQARQQGPPRGRPANGGQYYEDYDEGYMGETNAYFDPDSNAFVMPYAQPVSRRAMTPPPSGSRFPGGRSRGPPRNFSGSMNINGGWGPRPGSSISNQMGPRPGSSMSNAFPGPRSGSTMSGRFGPRKPMAPPADLTTLPTPSKLKDDSFALLGAIDFAPPNTFKDQQIGRRAQSPLGERRPYQLNVPVSSPLVSAFDEMATLPSPHLLRKSSTFTGLDFAPPRKFKDPETMSDAGSIRSNRSGISAVQQMAIRSGAGRVSRLPGDTVFTQAALSETLKPSWDMRN